MILIAPANALKMPTKVGDFDRINDYLSGEMKAITGVLFENFWVEK